MISWKHPRQELQVWISDSSTIISLLGGCCHPWYWAGWMHGSVVISNYPALIWLGIGHWVTDSWECQHQRTGGTGIPRCSADANTMIPSSQHQKLPLLREKPGSIVLICVSSAVLWYGWMLNYSMRTHTYSSYRESLIVRMRWWIYQNTTLKPFNT